MAKFYTDKAKKAALLYAPEVLQGRKLLKGDTEAQQKADFDYLCEWLEKNLGHPAERELPISVCAKVRGFELPSGFAEARRKAEANKAKASVETAKDPDTAQDGDGDD